ncbi:hypothetical protein XCY_000610 [Xanthomonas euroxanthea]|uniref:hypothetical protein n=1 Tax=Xanthomonas euroxanthea TaxID=2259622 RepID=UPI001AF9826E|nr:hypothetical protein [Xanthomonas euroxanthea]CAG2084324.1 hypothetical protein XCY_000610 [Xanthomonas euroxanthea]
MIFFSAHVTDPASGTACGWGCAVSLLVSMAACLILAAPVSGTPVFQQAVVASGSRAQPEAPDVMRRLRQDIDRLVITDFKDIATLDSLLTTRLGPIQSRDGMAVRVGSNGLLAGIAVRNIELRGAQEDRSRTTLVIEVLPSRVLFDDAAWADALPYPPHPDAPGSRAYRLLQVGTTRVVIGLTEDQLHVSYITVSKT